MNYNRLLDIDFISSRLSSNPPAIELRSLDGIPYQGSFQFENNLIYAHSAKQEEKLTHISRNTAANLNRDILDDSSNGLYPDQRDGKLSRQLCELTYIHTYADLHKIQQNPDATYPCLQKLMRWVCDAMTTGKIVIRVHGTAYHPTARMGFVREGNTSVSISKVIACFIKNGLCASSEFRLLGIKTQPGKKPREMWQPDEEALTCSDPRCTRTFKLFVRRHHCRRCGQIFCDRHSSKTRRLHEALSKTAGKTKLNGEAVRVCDTCADEYDKAARENGTADQRRRLGTHTGGLRTFKIFSCEAASHSSERTMGQRPDEAKFDISSIAHEAVAAFRAGNVIGVKVTASPYTLNQVPPSDLMGFSVSGYSEGGTLIVRWPDQNGLKEVEFRRGGTAILPRSIHGQREDLRQAADIPFPTSHRQLIAIDTIQAGSGDRTILFGGASPGAGIAALKNALKLWRFAGCTVLHKLHHGMTTFSIHFPEEFVERVEVTNNSGEWKIFWARSSDTYLNIKFKHIKVCQTT